MKGLACAFTGHRKIESAHREKIDELVMRGIAYAYDKGCRRFYAGGALGFDTVAAKQVLLFKITHPDAELHLIIPCKNQDEKWSDMQRKMYEYILSRADGIEILSDSYTPDCMRRRNARLVSLADMIIAYSGRTNSGAAQTVRMAECEGKTVYNLFPTLNN